MPLLWDFLQWEDPNLALLIHSINRHQTAGSYQAVSVLGTQWVSVSMKCLAYGAMFLSTRDVISLKSHLGREVRVAS